MELAIEEREMQKAAAVMQHDRKNDDLGLLLEQLTAVIFPTSLTLLLLFLFRFDIHENLLVYKRIFFFISVIFEPF